MSIQSLIAHYLQENGYTETLAAFQKEHGTLLKAEPPLGESLLEIVADRRIYEQTERTNKKTTFRNWGVPYADKQRDVRVAELVVDAAIFGKHAVLATSRKSLLVADLEDGSLVFEAKNAVSSVVRRVLVHGDRLFLCGMDGTLTVGTLDVARRNFEPFLAQKIHPRLVIDVKIAVWQGKTYLVSMGWDLMVKVFLVGEELELKGEVKLPTQGACIEALVHSDTLYLFVGRKEITLMDVFTFDGELKRKCRVALSDAEFSAVGFTPMCISALAGEVPMLAVATSHEPFMRVIVVSLPENDAVEIHRLNILANLNTLSPQDKYSDAKILWREDGSGIWIAGEDGKMRGLDLQEEKVVVTVDAHEGRMKSVVFGENLLTCGVDKTVRYWTRDD